MSGWQAIILGGTCATGALLFLTIVAHAIGSVVSTLDAFEARQKRAHQRECAENETMVAEAVPSEASPTS